MKLIGIFGTIALLSACAVASEPTSEEKQPSVDTKGVDAGPSSCPGGAVEGCVPGCVVESHKELCWDHADNNCNGQTDEGCP